MRHYIWYDLTGRLGASLDHPGAWIGKDLSDPDVPDQSMQELRDAFINDDGFVECIPYDCDCLAYDYTCDCAVLHIEDYFWSGTGLQLKYVLTAVVDGTPVPHMADLDKTADATVTYKLTCAEAPDGLEVELQDYDGAPMLDTPSPRTLTFTSGETEQINLTVPVMGLKGRICVMIPIAHVALVCIRGT